MVSVPRASKAISSKPLAANQRLSRGVRSGWPAVPGPDHRRARAAQGRRGLDGALDVTVADVAEDAAQQQHASGQRVREAGHQAGVRLADVYLRQPGVGGRAAGQGGVGRVGLDQDGTDIVTAGMARQHPDHVVTLPGAEADQADRSRGSPVNGPRQVVTDPAQPRA